MKFLTPILFLTLLFTPPLLASTITMCPGGGVKTGDSNKTVEKKCGRARFSSMTSFRLEGESHMLATKKIVFKDGTNILFIFVDNKVVSGQILN